MQVDTKEPQKYRPTHGNIRAAILHDSLLATMHRILKLKTPLLSLVLAGTAEVLLFVTALMAGRASSPDHPVLAAQFIGWFHRLPEWLTMSFMAAFKPFQDIRSAQAQITVTLMVVFFALLEWYLTFLFAIGVFRRFYRGPAANNGAARASRRAG